MINNNEEAQTGQDLKSDDEFSDEKTSLKIHRHLADINDEISDQDIKNVKTSFNGTVPADIIEDKKIVENEEEKKKTEEEKEDAQPIVTPWNILGN